MSNLPFAKKGLGQHWLEDKTILKSIVDEANISSGDTILEIGPGTGTLTDVLIDSGATIRALEYDQQRYLVLLNKYRINKKVSIIYGDIRSFDLYSLPSNYKIVANIPYYLTANLLRKLVDVGNKPSIVVLLVQKEVALRIASQQGQLSQLAVFIQVYYQVKLGVIVPAKFFVPPPKVDSQVLILLRKGNPDFAIDDKFVNTVKAGFSEKRKKIRSSLANGLKISKSQSEQYLDQAGISNNARAQELSVDDWHRLSQCIK